MKHIAKKNLFINKAPGWSDSHSPYDKTNPRAIAEEELLSLSQGNIRTTVLNLSGLWGGERDPRNWVNRVAPTKEALAEKVRRRYFKKPIYPSERKLKD